MVLTVISLAAHDGDDEPVCVWSFTKIAKLANCSRQSVVDALNELEMLGEVVVERKTGTKNKYFLTPLTSPLARLVGGGGGGQVTGPVPVKSVDQTGQATGPVPVKSVDQTGQATGPPTKQVLQDQNQRKPQTQSETVPAAPVPATFEEWHKLLKDAGDRSKRIGVLGQAFSTLFPDLGPPDYALIGRTAKNLNNVSVVLRHFWNLSAKRVDCLDCEGLMQYILRIESNERSRRAGGYGEVDPDPSEEDRDQHFSGFNRV